MKIGIVSGIHEDIENLKVAISQIKEKNCDTIVCLGDLVGFTKPYYGHEKTRNANEVVNLIKDSCEHVVVGNHDIVPIKRIPNQTPFTYPETWYEMSFEEREVVSNGEVWLCDDDLDSKLGNDEKSYLRSLPEYKVIKTPEVSILISHYAFPNIIGDHVKTDPVDDNGKSHIDFAKSKGCDISIFSHDLQVGIRLFDGVSAAEHPFGRIILPQLLLALNAPWVANGTEPNGYVILDTIENTIEAIPLNAKPHIVPTHH